MTASPVLISNAGGLDVLAAVAGQLGFHPQDSVVICGLMPPRGRLGPIIRADLVSLAHPEARAAIRANLERVREVGAEGAFVARYRSQLVPSLRDDRAFDEALTLVEGLFQLVGLWDVGPGGIREHDVSTRRPVGPLFGDDDLKGTRAAAALVFQGVSTTGRREDLARIGWAAAGERRAARSAERRAWDQSLALTPAEVGRWRLGELDNWQHWLSRLGADPAEPTPAATLGRFHALLRDPRGRDAVIATPFRAGEAAARQLALGAGGSMVLDPIRSVGIDERKAAPALELLSRTLAHIAPTRRGIGYSVGAAWHWWLGSGAAAREWARSALECVNPTPLAPMVCAALDAGFWPPALLRRVGRGPA